MTAEADALVREVAIQVQRQAALSTPIDTAAAIMDWRIGVGTPPATADERLYPTRQAGARYGPPPSRGPAVARSGANATRAIAGYTGTNGPVYVSNGRPYIGRLNDGYSGQAAAGFVELAVQAGLAAVRTRRFLR